MVDLVYGHLADDTPCGGGEPAAVGLDGLR
jgi:hypothetical protein